MAGTLRPGTVGRPEREAAADGGQALGHAPQPAAMSAVRGGEFSGFSGSWPGNPRPSSVTSRDTSSIRSVSRIRQCRAPEWRITLVTASRRHQASTASASGSKVPDRRVSPASSSSAIPAASSAFRAVMTSMASVGLR